MTREHAHAHDARGRQRVLWAMLLTAGFMVVEVAGGLLAGSLALLSDAAHMLTDSAALGLAWMAFRLADRPADARRSYGWQRMPTLAAFVNGMVLIALVVWIAVEAVGRLLDPQPVAGGLMLGVAVAGLLVNLAAFAVLHGGDREDLNLRGALLHVIGDLLGSMAAIVGAGVILVTGWMPVDPLLSLLVSVLILRAAVDLTRRSGHVLLEGGPAEPAPETLARTLVETVPGLAGVHHVHVWSLTPTRPLVTLHADAEPGVTDQDTLLARISTVLAERFGVTHATVQIERGACPDGPPGERSHVDAPCRDGC